MKTWTLRGFIAVFFILLSGAILMTILQKGLGGDNAVFIILGYVGGWLSAVTVFFFPKPETK